MVQRDRSFSKTPRKAVKPAKPTHLRQAGLVHAVDNGKLGNEEVQQRGAVGNLGLALKGGWQKAFGVAHAVTPRQADPQIPQAQP